MNEYKRGTLPPGDNFDILGVGLILIDCDGGGRTGLVLLGYTSINYITNNLSDYVSITSVGNYRFRIENVRTSSFSVRVRKFGVSR